MSIMDNEVIDSQFIADNIGFLDNCFDNSFVLHTSLQVVKDHAADQNELKLRKSKKTNKNVSNLLQTTRTSFDSTQINPVITQLEKNNSKLSNWGLPTEITKKYEDRGITEMFEWQVACLSNSKVLFDCCNLVYSAPTSAGKTLVAEILTIKTILERQKKVIIILPFVSIVREKMFYLQDILSSSGIRVEGFMGSQSPPGGLQAVHVAICTIEKANSLVNRLLDEGSISELGAIVVDELHLLGDPSRGYILELLLTKIKYVSSNSNDVQIQIVGMSATLPNLEMLANWLDAELFVTQFRPIPLDEFCLVGSKYYDKQGKHVNTIDAQITPERDNVLNICLDTIKDGCSILIFCMTKNWCESLAQSIAVSFYKIGCEESEPGLILRNQLKTDNIQEVLEQLKNCPVGLDQVLKKTISFGVAYHHAGLTFDERDIVEGGFKSGAIRVLVATSTLSSGVNLPARKVIIRSPVFLRQPINILTYKQMIGRAGRMGKDSKGESILICTEAEKKIGFDLMMGSLDPVKSCIESEDKYMRAVLEMIASQVVSSKEQLDLYSKCTLLYTQQDLSESQNILLENTLDELTNFELVRVQKEGDEEHYIATPLGKACLSSSMAPNDGLSLFCELQKARQCLVLETDLHLIYLVTPYSVSSQWGNIDWIHLLTLWESLTKAMKRVGELVGVQESFIIRCLRGANKASNVQNKVNIHKRFYTALALQDLVNEVPLAEVANKFQCARGFLQSLQQGAATFAGMVTAFCRQLGWKNMEMLISQFQDRLHFGIHSELLELMRLPSLNGMRARTLFDSGFESISSIASADANTIENILHKSMPFQSDKVREEDDCDDIRKRNKMKSIWITGYCGITTKEAAENLIAEARKYLSLEIGVAEIKWDSKPSTTESPDATQNKDGNETSSKNVVPEYLNACNSKLSQPNETLSTTLSQERKKKDVLETSRLRKDSVSDSAVSVDDVNKIGEACSSVNNSPSVTVKEDIIWDSLNFTEAGLSNMTKLRTSDKMFSPNISFGEIVEKVEKKSDSKYEEMNSSQHMSAKDISLFSSEGDNSSLFEESLPIDLINSGLLEQEPTALRRQESDFGYASINSNTILNAFQSTLVDDDEDIKLVYEEDKVVENELLTTNNKANEVINTQTNKKMISSKRRKNSKDEIQPLVKKKKENEIEFYSFTKSPKFNRSCFRAKLKSSLSKTFTIEIYNIKMNCFILRDDDIKDNFCQFSGFYYVVMYLHVIESNFTSNELIGSNIINITKNEINKANVKEDCPIKGIAFYLNDDLCVYLDLTTLNDMKWFQSELNSLITNKSKIKVLCSKTMTLYLKRWLNIEVSSYTNCVDILLTEWLLDSGEKVFDIDALMKKYCGVDITKMLLKIDNQQKRYKTLESFEKSCIKVWSLGQIIEYQEKRLAASIQPASNTIAIENQVARVLANCEYYGITVDKDLASKLLIDVKISQETLEKKAYKLCGYHFNFNSSKDVAKVLGIYNGRKVSTKKSVLTSHNSPMSSIIIYWRKLNSILTKTLYPLTEKACMYSEGGRINPSYTMFTCTGRISMHEPNLQNVPRTFSIPSQYLSMGSGNSDDVVEFNCRNIFKAAPGCAIVSADYCQLEMRILTHFSQDRVLMDIMNSDMDVFKSIAATWSDVPEEEVDDDLRQKAKQLCYAIIYGMGTKTLSQILDVPETEAALFMSGFYKTYPAVKVFTQSVIEDCRKNGYVETLTKRRRYLPDINSNVISKRNAAERQAVNTMIQGSAADIAKAAMCSIDSWNSFNRNNGPRLILQMHDELIYEVPEESQHSFIATMRRAMQKTVKLSVPLPVKVKTGLAWGTLSEVKYIP
ncbi:unnamed protein product [Chrysodeixis includens]|uniref:DNA polymerase theta n=1 Tax=Chrysodeixis includens TaxID=689277 RepID=A0A9P0C0U4_CHRIL|nr:unnamed protein product [Chrysodeixis includens]